MSCMMEETQRLNEGKVYLTGGGCGDADLLTLKAWKVLHKCDTVVYDSLVSEELLQWTPPDCEKIYVGKRYGCHSMGQPEINALLVEKAREGKTVVRLKGGDPYVFGRGGEEFMALRDAGICCEVIPGITSAVAVPAAAGIPVTHRGLSDSVTVVTGTAAGGKGESELDFGTLAQLKGTLVILMGMHHLAEIVTRLLAAGKDRNTPCAIIMEGTTERQRVLRAPLFELPARAAKQGFSSPAVIVVGAVAGLSLTTGDGSSGETGRNDRKHISAECAWMKNVGERSDNPDAVNAETGSAGGDRTEKARQPLAGISVGVTGTAHFAARMSLALREKGADIRDMSFMEIRPAKDPLPDLSRFGWLVFTSPNGVRVFLDKMREERCDLRSLSSQKIAVIGPGTAEAFQEAGIYVDYMPQIYDSRHLAEGLARLILETQAKTDSAGAEGRRRKACGNGGRCPVLLLRARQGSDMLPKIFRERGISYEVQPLYDLGVQEEKRDAVIEEKPDYIVFGSAMGAKAYFEGLKKKEIRNTVSRYVCIGKQCAEEARKYTAQPLLTAERADVEAIAACLCREVCEKNF